MKDKIQALSGPILESKGMCAILQKNIKKKKKKKGQKKC